MRLYGYQQFYIQPGINRKGNQSWGCFCCCCVDTYRFSRIDKRKASKKRARRLGKKEIIQNMDQHLNQP